MVRGETKERKAQSFLPEERKKRRTERKERREKILTFSSG
jgi:hypothetical protein